MAGDQTDWEFMNEFWFKVTFVYRCETPMGGGEEEEVYLVGDFNQWNQGSHRMNPCPEGYTTTLSLSEGFYHYKFLAGGKWLRDFANPHVGGPFENSIMFVHMDPKVYGLRDQNPPHREYHRPDSDGGHFHVLCPPIPQDIGNWGVLQRQIFVYLPPSYNSDPNRRYPVVYANDGQNLFSTPEHMGGPCRGGWFLDAKLDHYWSERSLPEFILVGVPNSDFVCIGNRNREYCTSQFRDTSNDPYSRYLTEVVKKEIDENFRTLPSAENSIILGASMGGLCAFTLCLTRPETFSSCISMSPAFWYVDGTNATAFDLVRMLTSDPPQKPLRVYIDSGDGAGDNFYETVQMKEAFVDAGWREGKDFRYVLDKCSDRVDMGITHSESVWAQRILPALQFALKHGI
jgi:predicted alpha/beta superfamily hydrolase